MPPRDTQESVTVDGHEGRILGFCGVPPAPQIEATVVVDKRAYLFTLYDGREVAQRGGGSGAVRQIRGHDHARSRERGGLAEAEPFLSAGRQSGNASGPRSLSSRASPEASSAGSHEYG